MSNSEIRPLEFVVVLMVGAAIVWWIFPSNQPAQSVIPLAPPGWSRNFTDLRDEGIADIGWVAGNARGHPIWPDVKMHFGEEGDVYDRLMMLGTPGQTQTISAGLNVALYDRSVEQGAAAYYDEAEETRRAVRVSQIFKELGELLKARK